MTAPKDILFEDKWPVPAPTAASLHYLPPNLDEPALWPRAEPSLTGITAVKRSPWKNSIYLQLVMWKNHYRMGPRRARHTNQMSQSHLDTDEEFCNYI